MEIKNCVAVVTGAGSGIGRAMALALAGEGADVVAADVNDDGLKEVCREIEGLGRRALPVNTDVSRLDSIQNLYERTMAVMGRADILVNNAGVHMSGPFDKVTHNDWEWIININLWGVINGVHVFLPHFLERGSGHIVNTASIAGQVGSADLSIPYTVSKFGVVGFSEGLAVFLRSRGVGVTVICPGLVQTNISEASRQIKAGDETDIIRDRLREAMKGKKWTDTPRLREAVVLMPEDVAGQMVMAIKANTFLVLTHPRSIEMIQERMNNIEGMIERRSREAVQREKELRDLFKGGGPSA